MGVGGDCSIGPKALRLPVWSVWNNYFLLLGCSSAFQFLIGLCTHTVLTRLKKGNPYVMPVLVVGWALCFSLPFILIETLGITNPLFRFTLGCFSITSLFKQQEAIQGTTPAGAMDSLQGWLVHYTSIIEPQYKDGKPKKPEQGELLMILKRFFMHMAINSVVTSLSMWSLPHYVPFSDHPCGFLSGCNTLVCKVVKTLGNGLIQGSVLYANLGMLSDLLSLMLVLTGFSPSVVMKNPLLRSTSPMDFWGRRWNLTIHGILKRSYFTPVKKRFGAAAGSFAAFMASGLFHEFVWYILFWHTDKSDIVVHGEALLFFLINFGFCCMPWPSVTNISPYAAPLLTLATLCLGLYFSDLFCGPLIDGEVMYAFVDLIPTVVPLATFDELKRITAY